MLNKSILASKSLYITNNINYPRQVYKYLHTECAKKKIPTPRILQESAEQLNRYSKEQQNEKENLYDIPKQGILDDGSFGDIQLVEQMSTFQTPPEIQQDPDESRALYYLKAAGFIAMQSSGHYTLLPLG